jgi:hypothetical protein
MPSSGMLRLVALLSTGVSEETNASIFRVTRIGEIGTTLAVTNNRRTANVAVFSGKIPVRTSQETHYVSATELSQLMLYKI